MGLAIKKAKEVGVAWVTCTGKFYFVWHWHYSVGLKHKM